MENCEEVVVTPAPEKKPFNVFALLGMIFAIAVNNYLGIAFSIIGLIKSKQWGGKGFAIAGLIIAIASQLSSFLILATLVPALIIFYIVYFIILTVVLA